MIPTFRLFLLIIRWTPWSFFLLAEECFATEELPLRRKPNKMWPAEIMQCKIPIPHDCLIPFILNIKWAEWSSQLHLTSRTNSRCWNWAPSPAAWLQKSAKLPKDICNKTETKTLDFCTRTYEQGTKPTQTVPEMQAHWTQIQAPGAGKERGTATSSKRSDRTAALCHQSSEGLKINPQPHVKEQERCVKYDRPHQCMFISVISAWTQTVRRSWMTHPAALLPPGRGPGCRGKTRHPWPELRSGKPFAGGQNTHLTFKDKAQLC